jgi:3-methyladenine DNA glycosylase AlkD
VTVDEILRWLEQRGTRRNRDGMARFGIVAPRVFGVSMATMRPLVKRVGRDHRLALALWETGWLEARIMASFVDEPALVSPAQMDRWALDFDNWAVCDSVCLHLFDRTPYAWRKVYTWSRRRPEFVKRAAFATLAGLATHDKQSGDEPFVKALGLVSGAAHDDRNFVKKAVNWALRGIGKRNPTLYTQALRVAHALAGDRASRSARWIGTDAIRELSSSAVRSRMER